MLSRGEGTLQRSKTLSARPGQGAKHSGVVREQEAVIQQLQAVILEKEAALQTAGEMGSQAVQEIVHLQRQLTQLESHRLPQTPSRKGSFPVEEEEDYFSAPSSPMVAPYSPSSPHKKKRAKGRPYTMFPAIAVEDTKEVPVLMALPEDDARDVEAEKKAHQETKDALWRAECEVETLSATAAAAQKEHLALQQKLNAQAVALQRLQDSHTELTVQHANLRAESESKLLAVTHQLEGVQQERNELQSRVKALSDAEEQSYRLARHYRHKAEQSEGDGHLAERTVEREEETTSLEDVLTLLRQSREEKVELEAVLASMQDALASKTHTRQVSGTIPNTLAVEYLRSQRVSAGTNTVHVSQQARGIQVSPLSISTASQCAQTISATVSSVTSETQTAESIPPQSTATAMQTETMRYRHRDTQTGTEAPPSITHQTTQTESNVPEIPEEEENQKAVLFMEAGFWVGKYAMNALLPLPRPRRRFMMIHPGSCTITWTSKKATSPVFPSKTVKVVRHHVASKTGKTRQDITFFTHSGKALRIYVEHPHQEALLLKGLQQMAYPSSL